MVHGLLGPYGSERADEPLTRTAPTPSSPSLISHFASVDVKQHVYLLEIIVFSPYGLCGRKATLNLNWSSSELRSCVKVEVAVLGSPSLISLMVSVEVKKHGINECSSNPHLPHLHTPIPHFSPSLISRMVYVDVKHHVYLTLSTMFTYLLRA